LNPLTLGLAVALVASSAANVAIGWTWVGTRDRLAVAAIERDNARAAATACSDATEVLRTLADQRALEAKTSQVQARAVANQHAQLAQTILGTPAAIPVLRLAEQFVDDLPIGVGQGHARLDAD
jgi:hypothetical protein